MTSLKKQNGNMPVKKTATSHQILTMKYMAYNPEEERKLLQAMLIKSPELR